MLKPFREPSDILTSKSIKSPNNSSHLLLLCRCLLTASTVAAFTICSKVQCAGSFAASGLRPRIYSWFRIVSSTIIDSFFLVGQFNFSAELVTSSWMRYSSAALKYAGLPLIPTSPPLSRAVIPLQIRGYNNNTKSIHNPSALHRQKTKMISLK